jgi:hypothetical protein
MYSMINHIDLDANPELRSRKVRSLIRNGRVKLGGNRRLKIYGMLSCSSGKRMKAENRVFFETEQEAINAGYRPCGHCMKGKYTRWKSKSA